jgi:UDP-N-acetylmuramoyl-L-alanyl-D-glutamate--2,6-diaminopimelate ligase
MTLGVTGTFGETVTSLFVHSILEAAGLRCGLIGSLGWSDGRTKRPLGAGIDIAIRPGLTPAAAMAPNPAGTRVGQAPCAWPAGAAGLATILAYMVDQNCAAGVIEISAEAIADSCLEGVSFRAAVVTDVGVPSSLPAEIALADRRVMAKLFRKIAPGGAAVVNADDPHAEILGAVNLDARRVSFGLAHPTQVDVSARIERLDSAGSRFVLYGFDRSVKVDLRLYGPRQVSHAVAAAALAWALEIDLDAVVAGLEGVTNVSGFLEAVDEGQDFDVRIDAAQTAASLYEALTAIRAVGAGQVHCVLSAEGHQDQAARRNLAEVAQLGADRVILTLGNPRSEPPDQIFDDLLGGFHRPGKVRVEPDRKRAIDAALADARPGDSVLIAGKGRDAYQIFANRVIPFDDFAVARAFLRRRLPLQTCIAARSA